MAYLPTRESSSMTNGRYAAQKINTKAIFFTGHETISNERLIDGRTGLLVLAGIFLILHPIQDCLRTVLTAWRFSTILRFGLCSLCRDGLGRRTALVWRLPVPSFGQAIEIQEDDGRGVERQELAQRQPANDGVAERLAELGAASQAEDEGHGAHHRRHLLHDSRATARV